MKWSRVVAGIFGVLLSAGAFAQAAKKPNILVIWGDDIGQFNISAYNMGMMGYTTKRTRGQQRRREPEDYNEEEDRRTTTKKTTRGQQRRRGRKDNNEEEDPRTTTKRAPGFTYS